jgi:hypothetical protein
MDTSADDVSFCRSQDRSAVGEQALGWTTRAGRAATASAVRPPFIALSTPVSPTRSARAASNRGPRPCATRRMTTNRRKARLSVVLSSVVLSDSTSEGPGDPAREKGQQLSCLVFFCRRRPFVLRNATAFHAASDEAGVRPRTRFSLMSRRSRSPGLLVVDRPQRQLC